MLQILCLILAAFLISCQSGGEERSGLRIVALSPEVAEIIAALGGAEDIVGLTQECDHPPSLDKIQKVGKFGSVKREAILALKPDLVFTSALEQEALTQELLKMGLRVEQVYPRSLDDLPRNVLRIGSLIDREQEARALADSIAIAINEMRAKTAGTARPKVYLEIYRDPLMSVSDDSFVGEVIEAAGGDNIFSTLERDYARIKAENVVTAKPDIIICFSQDNRENILARKGWQDIPAIQNERVYFESDIDPDLILQATPRTVQGIRRLNELFRQ
ncbi:MAG: cobalamin-binding protein [Candidatus Syntrophosphaera sp.]